MKLFIVFCSFVVGSLGLYKLPEVSNNIFRTFLDASCNCNGVTETEGTIFLTNLLRRSFDQTRDMDHLICFLKNLNVLNGEGMIQVGPLRNIFSEVGLPEEVATTCGVNKDCETNTALDLYNCWISDLDI